MLNKCILITNLIIKKLFKLFEIFEVFFSYLLAISNSIPEEGPKGRGVRKIVFEI